MTPADRPPAGSLGELPTEEIRGELAALDELAVDELVAVLAADAGRALEAVVTAVPAIARAVELATACLQAGGRLVYVGAGTAGRIAVLDATELGPTFDVPAGMVEAVLAGGDGALRRAAEGAEDDEAAGAGAMAALGVGPGDVVVGVSASGRTPFVVAALRAASERGGATVAVTCNPSSAMAEVAELSIETVVGGEVLAGSSRLNAGTAQKLVLNALSTATMVRLGKTYGNLMVDFRPTNTKLRDRATRIVQVVAGVDEAAAHRALEACGWVTKLACLVARTGAPPEQAARTLEAAGGRLREALDARQAPAQRRDGGARRLGVGAALVGGRLVTGDVSVEDGAIRAVGLAGSGDRVAVAGLVDLQVNGYAGIDALSASEDELAAMGAALARDGVLAYQPTLITSDPAVLRAATARIGALARRTAGPARILGVHLEGPFLSPGRAGTHPVAALRSPDGALAAGLVATGPVTMVTLAPELPGGLELVASLVARGVRVALGHSAASAEVARLAADAGASAVTHLFNAMSPVTARAPGLVAAALVDRRLAVQVIADGVHVADDNLRLAFAAAPGRCSIVTDATSLARAVASARTLGEVTIARDGGVARRADGTIAGGTTPLVAALRHLVEIGVGLEDALAAATERPARLLGRDDVGRLRLGAPADVVVLDGDLRLAQVLAAGRTVDPAQ